MSKWIKIFLAAQILLFLASCNNRSRRIIRLEKNYKGSTISTPKGNCVVEYDDLDKLTGDRITEIKTEKIFVFTHDELKEYFTNRPFIECEGGLSRVADKYFLNLTFIIDSKYIKTGYKGLAKNGMLKVTLLNGDNLYLKNVITDLGKRNNIEKSIVYKGVFPISKYNMKFMRKNEISKLGVEWNGGVEEYDVFDIDFVIRQKMCLDKVE